MKGIKNNKQCSIVFHKTCLNIYIYIYIYIYVCVYPNNIKVNMLAYACIYIYTPIYIHFSRNTSIHMHLFIFGVRVIEQEKNTESENYTESLLMKKLYFWVFDASFPHLSWFLFLRNTIWCTDQIMANLAK